MGADMAVTETPDALHEAPPEAPLQGLRVALLSGNYNYVRDGANQALNRLVGYLQRQGARCLRPGP